MRKLLTLALASCVLSLTCVAMNAGIARADEPCTTPAPVGTEPVTVGVGGKEVHVPGVKVQICASPHGNVGYADKWLAVRIAPGSCLPSLFDPACFTVYVESDGIPHWTNFTIYTFVDGVPQAPISVDLPPIPQPVSICVLSIGYPGAPTHDCNAFVDLGQ